ncbi:YccF domain-containing protein OS=Streptomyces alboniger OX=132473 GN=CP975_20750 PE=4 SV=1 [Streptomyces alboniger]
MAGPAGRWLALAHIVTGIALCLTIIGIPFGVANFKLIPVSLLPLGREIVPTDQPFAAR